MYPILSMQDHLDAKSKKFHILPHCENGRFRIRIVSCEKVKIRFRISLGSFRNGVVVFLFPFGSSSFWRFSLGVTIRSMVCKEGMYIVNTKDEAYLPVE